MSVKHWASVTPGKPLSYPTAADIELLRQRMNGENPLRAVRIGNRIVFTRSPPCSAVIYPDNGRPENGNDLLLVSCPCCNRKSIASASSPRSSVRRGGRRLVGRVLV
jgi:hypothetical protein